jgi:hypothetical protein
MESTFIPNENKVKKRAFISKDLAEKNVELLMQMVDKINDENADKHMYPRRVKTIIVFGSYLSDKKILGDVDIFYELESRWDNIMDEATFFGSRFGNNIFKRYSASENFILNILRCKKKSFSFHNIDEFEYMSTMPNFIYEYLVQDFKPVKTK